MSAGFSQEQSRSGCYISGRDVRKEKLKLTPGKSDFGLS